MVSVIEEMQFADSLGPKLIELLVNLNGLDKKIRSN